MTAAFALLAVLALAGIVGTIRLVVVDGHRRIPAQCDRTGASADAR
jgi:hypothetical protein